MFLVNLAQCFSTNIAKCSITVLQPVVRSLTETIGLCILYWVLFFPSWALMFAIQDVLSWNISLFENHFAEKVFRFFDIWEGLLKINPFFFFC